MPPSYTIDTPQSPSPRFMEARAVAGRTLENQFRSFGGRAKPQHDFRWIKAELTWPSFDHLTFAYRNKVFSVLVNVVATGQSSLTDQERGRCLEAARQNDLVPCVFTVEGRTLQPITGQWNLTHLADGHPICPQDIGSEQRAVMSGWELSHFAIQVVRQHIQQQGTGRVLSFCDVPEMDPQIWWETGPNKRSWIIVRFFSALRGDEKQSFVDIRSRFPHLAKYDGYFAGVSAASSEPILLDVQGSVIPPSRRFDGTAPLYRGDGFYIKFNGMERIHAA